MMMRYWISPLPQADDAVDLRNLDEARVRSLADKDAEAAARKPLAQWPDAELLERFADSRVLPLVRRHWHNPHCHPLPRQTRRRERATPYMSRRIISHPAIDQL